MQDLHRRLQQEIDNISTIDIHSHISLSSPTARSLNDILFYHYILTELFSCGMPPYFLDKDISPEEKIENALPYIERIKNTTTFWCLSRILKDLYGFEEITKKNWQKIDQKVKLCSAQKNWTKNTLENNAKINTTFLTIELEDERIVHQENLFRTSLRVDNWINPFELKKNVSIVEERTKISVKSLQDFVRGIEEIIDSKKKVCLTVALGEETNLDKPGKNQAETIFSRIMGKGPLTEWKNTMGIIRSYLIHSLIQIARDLNIPFQIMLGVRRPLPGNKELVFSSPRMLTPFYSLFSQYPNVSFDLILASIVHSQELCAAAKNYPNVYISGYWWYSFYPVYIRKMLEERIQILPLTKIGGFFSDAYVVEWSYGKVALVRKELANVLCNAVEQRYLTEKLALRVAKSILDENPRKLYRL